MIEAILDGYRRTAAETGRAAPRAAVVEAMRAVPREAFVLDDDLEYAYDNRPLSIGHGQTISQPYVVALMIDMIDPTPETVALEVGTGCGYAAAVLSRCVKQVYTIECVPELARGAARRLARLGIDNVAVRAGDGHAGWPEHAPYGAIVVTAAPTVVPRRLVDQLAPGGRMVVPVGRPYREQELRCIERNADGALTESPVLPVAFVPMVDGREPTDGP